MPNGYQSNYTGAQHDNYVTKQELIDLIYPINSIYISLSEVSPAVLFGGEWEQIKDKFLLSAGDTYIAGNTGGAASLASDPPNTDVSGSTAITAAQMPRHTHVGLFWNYADNAAYNISLNTGKYAYKLTWTGQGNTTTAGAGANDRGFVVGQTGNGAGHTHTLSAHTHTVAIMPPYLTVYMWKRTA